MWKEKASSQQMYSTSISANRGNIYDRNMKTLAKSVTVWTVFISPAEMEEDQRELVASGLSEILDVDYDMVYEKSLKTWRYNETIKKKVDNDTADEVTAFIKENDIKGIYLSEDTMRYYPYGNLASTVLGFTGNDGTGAYGLEAYYNKTLSGTNGVIASVRNAKGTAMPFSEQQIYDAEDGQSLVLTIDETVQHYLEKHLENAVQEHEVQNRAVGIVMNVKTGEILGMSTKPDFDPNNPSEILRYLHQGGAGRDERGSRRRRGETGRILYSPGGSPDGPVAEQGHLRPLRTGIGLQADHRVGGAGDRHSHRFHPVLLPGLYRGSGQPDRLLESRRPRCHRLCGRHQGSPATRPSS
ncbi:MAG: hypothetical protein V8Q30_06150 [Acutalibacteraceae bacterium]